MSNVAFVALIIIVIGLAMLFLVRWINLQNKKLKASGINDRMKLVDAALKNRDVAGLFKSYYFGSLPRCYAVLGRLLAIVIIVGVAFFLIFSIYAIYVAR